jgi:hypothetical protein
MSDYWSKEDRYHYNKSEVMQELEKRVMDNLHRLDILSKKAQTKTEETEQLTQSLTEAATAAKNLNAELNQADDEVAGDSLPQDTTIEEENKAEVVNDLRDMVQAALKENNIKLAYKIERTIDEILEQEIRCEL